MLREEVDQRGIGLAVHRARREADLDALAVAPCKFRTGGSRLDMQVEARSHSKEAFPSVQVFRDFHEKGLLVAPDVAAERIVTQVVEAPVEQGRTYSYAELGAPTPG